MKKPRYFPLILVAILALLPGAGFTQAHDSNDKQITRPNERNEPVDVVDIQTDEQKIAFGKTFRADDDWLKNFSVSLRNKTDKGIVSISLGLDFPETGETGNIMMYSLSGGTPRMAALKGERSVVVQPGNIIPISINEREFNKLKTFVGSRQPLFTLSKVQLSVQFILFDDGTAWALQYMIQDPNHSGRWIEDPNRKAFAQTKNPEDKIIKKLSFDNEPIKILKVTANGKDINFGETFTGNEEWLKDFTIKFRNVSGKTISFIDADLIFSETQTHDPPLAYVLQYGVPPKYKEDQKEGVQSLSPGETGEIVIHGRDFEKLKELVAIRKILNELTTADFTIQLVYFDDGMKWSGGDLWRPDPARPGSFIVSQK